MTKKKPLKLFVWYPALCDYTSGVMFALAEDAEQARAMLWQHRPSMDGVDLGRAPDVYTTPFALTVQGGG